MARIWLVPFIFTITLLVLFYFYLIFNVPALDGYKFENTNNAIIFQSKKSKEDKSQSNVSINKKMKKCETIHISMVCAGYNATNSLITTVKSILFYRTKPIHFHFLVDEISLRSLSILFSTWDLPQVTVTFYKTEELVPKVSWIPNKHYSGVYGLLKLILPDTIQESKVIVLDIDLTLQNDIYHLWKLFENISNKAMLGIIENQSDWYLKTSPYSGHPWPALGRGFNTGVMLMNLKLLRLKKFNQMWENITSMVLKNISETNLADQDIINTVIKYHPYIVSKLDCSWNVQLSDHSLSQICYIKADKINIIHWNSPRKQEVKHRYVQDFRKMHQVFLELDGTLLKRRLFSCPIIQPELQNDQMQDPCSKFQNTVSTVYRTHPFFLEFENNIVSEVDVLLATQCSIERITLLEELSKHWPGVISVALYLTDAEVQNFLSFFHNSIELKQRKNIAYHIVYKNGEYYPINYLRNVAMSYVNLPYIFQVDIDFLPKFGLHKNLLVYLNQQDQNILKNIALVIPAFETQRYRFKFPTSKMELIRYLNRGILYTFRYHVWSQGHAPTNFSLYKNSSEPYEINWEPDFEPYIVVPRDAPLYDTRFIGFGWNKVSYITHLTALGYRYVVLPDTFIIHQPHTPSRDIGKFRTDVLYRRCLKKLKDNFVEELLRKYGSNARINLKKLLTKENDKPRP